MVEVWLVCEGVFFFHFFFQACVTKGNGMWPPDVILVWPQNDFLKGNVTGHIPGHISKCQPLKGCMRVE